LVSLAGKTDIEELIGVIAAADLVASGDSGPLHLASAAGRPTLSVYGPTDPRIHGPYRPMAPSRLLRSDIVCSPCYSMAATAECPLGDPVCMRLVTVGPMVRAALDLLQPAAKTSF
jgi:heptosyltransferase-2